MKKRTVCGIDFGTSNTALSVVSDQSDVRLVNLEGQSQTIPSAIFFGAEDHGVLFGRAAISAYKARDEGRFMRSFKRALGTSLMSEGTTVGYKRLQFDEIIANFVSHVKSTAEAQTGDELEQVVVGRPVHFVDGSDEKNRQAQSQLEGIFKKSGFKDVRFQFEPIAAAFAHEAKLDDKEYMAVVLDIGGGTSDFSVIKLSQRYVNKPSRADDVLANTGIRIGGNDFDRKLSLQEFMPLLGMGTLMKDRGLTFPTAPFFDLSEWSKIQFMYAPKYKRQLLDTCRGAQEKDKIDRLVRVVEREQGHYLLGHVEDAKIALSADAATTTDLSFIENGLQLDITRSSFETAIADECEKIRAYTQECLKQAGVKGEDIDLVILTGGGTGIPAVQEVAKTEFPNARVSSENMLASVGLGLAYDASRTFLTPGQALGKHHKPGEKLEP